MGSAKGKVEKTGLGFGSAAPVRRMRYEDPVGACFCAPPTVATHVRLVESVGRKSRRTRSRCARRWEREDHDPAIFLALRRFADLELDVAFSRFVENDGDILWLGD